MTQRNIRLMGLGADGQYRGQCDGCGSVGVILGIETVTQNALAKLRELESKGYIRRAEYERQRDQREWAVADYSEAKREYDRLAGQEIVQQRRQRGGSMRDMREAMEDNEHAPRDQAFTDGVALGRKLGKLDTLYERIGKLEEERPGDGSFRIHHTLRAEILTVLQEYMGVLEESR